MPIKVLAILPAFIPSTIIDVITPLIDLTKGGVVDARITLEIFARKKDIDWCEVVILCRNTEPSIAEWFLHILHTRKPYIYDIDDNFFEISTNTPLGKYHRNPERIMMLKEYIRLSALVRVYSTPMLARAKSLNKRTIKVHAPVDWRLISKPQKNTETNIVKIVYATSRPDDYLANIFKPALKRILRKYPENVQMYFLGYLPEEFRVFTNVSFVPPIFNYDRYLRFFSQVGYDIGLAPLPNDIFHRSKTNNKFREYGASKIAGIYSNVDVYSDCVVNKKTGILVENTTDAWYKAMVFLIENKSMRLKIQNEAFKFTQKNYSQDAFVKLWQSQIKELPKLNSKRKSLKTVEKLINDYKTVNSIWERNFWLKFFKVEAYKKRLGWYWQRILNFYQNLKTYGLSYEIAKLQHYIYTFWILWTIRIQLFYIKNRRNY